MELRVRDVRDRVVVASATMDERGHLDLAGDPRDPDRPGDPLTPSMIVALIEHTQRDHPELDRVGAFRYLVVNGWSNQSLMIEPSESRAA